MVLVNGNNEIKLYVLYCSNQDVLMYGDTIVQTDRYSTHTHTHTHQSIISECKSYICVESIVLNELSLIFNPYQTFI